MKRGLSAAGVFLAALGLTACVGGGFGPGIRESLDESRPLSLTGELSLQNTNGSVHVATWSEPRVRIEATKTAVTRHALERIQVEIEGEGDRVLVRTRQPHGGFFFGGAGGVEYHVTVPRGARVSVRNVNGRVEIDGVAGRVEAETVNGSVEAEHLGSEVAASATNGSVEVEMDRVAASGRSRLHTTNGSVRLVLPRDAAAEIEARTVNGGVHCDFDLNGDARVSRRKIEGRIGSGGPRFELSTVNGSARVERGLAATAAAPPAEAPTR
jgi:hypothetical protein